MSCNEDALFKARRRTSKRSSNWYVKRFDGTGCLSRHFPDRLSYLLLLADAPEQDNPTPNPNPNPNPNP